MKVVEKNNLVHGMLNEELERCKSMLISLEQSFSNLFKGSLHVRKKRYKDHVYVYHYLKYREGKKSVSKHVPENQLEKLIKELESRNKIKNEMSSYKERIRYIEKLLKVGKL